MNKSVLSIISFLLLKSLIFGAANDASYYSGLGLSIKSLNKTGVKIDQYHTLSNISVIEYDTYGAETGYYIANGFSTTPKYDK